MPARKITFDTVRDLARSLPEVEESTSYGSPALKVRGQMFACIAINKSAEPNTLVVRVDFFERDALIAAEPDTYYLTPHYVDYACVLARLGRIKRAALQELLRTGYRFVSSRGKRRRSKRT
jgi:hypothetical protein